MTTRPVRARRYAFPALVAVTFVGLLATAPAALANTATSSNWSGFVAHRSGVHYRTVSAAWRVPAVSCQPGAPRYSAMWVGIGGFSRNSNALEQTGTEADCSATGKAGYYAWYELVPAPSQRITLRVRPGDLIDGRVNVAGHRVTLRLNNVSEHRRFGRTFTASSIDATSADWILEAPSSCTYTGYCSTLPLANFHHAAFGAAHALSTARRGGSISSGWWSRTKIFLAPTGTRYVGNGSGPGGASPSNLRNAGRAFTITYQSVAQPQGSYFATRASQMSAGHPVHTLANRRLVHPLYSP